MHSWKNGNPIIKDADIDGALVPQTRLTSWRGSNGEILPQVFLKREDEVRLGMTGGKLRKYASILPWLSKNGIRRVALIGSANSNHVLSAAMLLAEQQIEVFPFLKKGHHLGTNQFLLQLLVPSLNWHSIEAKDWPEVEAIAAEFVSGMADALVMPEGGCIPQALPGAMTLAADILRNEKDLQYEFQEVFIDAGTGLSAAGLLLGMHVLGMKARVHVTLMADSPERFLRRWQVYCSWFAELFGESVPEGLQNRFVFHQPVFAKSYGSVNAEVFATIQRYARWGILTDPIYSAKHLAAVEHYILSANEPNLPRLVIHSGGAQVLPGYEAMFRT